MTSHAERVEAQLRMAEEEGHWQVVHVTGVGIGEMWYDIIDEDLTREDAEDRADDHERRVAVPMPYSPDESVGIGEVVDDYDRTVVDR